MALNIVNDLGAPVIVAAVNIASKESTSKVLDQPLNDILAYGMTVGGYAVAWMGWGSNSMQEFAKNVAIASAPLSIEKIYNKMKVSGMAGRVTSPGGGPRRISRYPAPANESPFQGIRLV